PMNLLHVTSLVMVMGMGVDYGVFIVDSARDRKELDGTLFSLFLSCITTVFVFGTLAISQHAALRAMGATTGLGILLSFALAPVPLLLLPRAERVPRSTPRDARRSPRCCSVARRCRSHACRGFPIATVRCSPLRTFPAATCGYASACGSPATGWTSASSCSPSGARIASWWSGSTSSAR